ncbi:unnamed protein product [Mytilus coruscus]|uniref:Uncharacterized protein n=1 Tax=Mytilus coruscus TaxID=42192 RepID=A0A6J8AFD2_MYTCO|nr:unnamed protein product [Mytilus coruscus]
MVGPDHRTTYNSVKLSLIVLFKQLELEFLVACRTAPGHSWANPAERIMSLLNICFQNTALSREESTSDIDQIIKSCNGMSEIRRKSEKVDGLKDKLIESLKPMMTMLENRAKRVQLKGKPFQVFPAADDMDVEQTEARVTLFNPTISVGKYQQTHMTKARGFKEYIEKHCQERHYVFQIRRCSDAECCLLPSREWQWLPDPILDYTRQHYKAFEAVLGTVTTEKDRPSFTNQTIAAVAQEQQGCENRILVAQNVRSTVTCTECDKPRCVYSKLKLTPRDVRALKHRIDKYDYTCGAILAPEGDVLHGKVFVRLQMACTTHIEFSYYGSSVGRVDICAQCASPDTTKDPELLKKFKIVLPVCKACVHGNKEVPKTNPKK